MNEVAEVRLTGRGVDDSLDRDAEEREPENEYKYPEDEVKEV